MDVEKLVALVRRMSEAEHYYGCGYYSYEVWLEAKEELRELCGCESYEDYQARGGPDYISDLVKKRA